MGRSRSPWRMPPGKAAVGCCFAGRAASSLVSTWCHRIWEWHQVDTTMGLRLPSFPNPFLPRCLPQRIGPLVCSYRCKLPPGPYPIGRLFSFQGTGEITSAVFRKKQASGTEEDHVKGHGVPSVPEASHVICLDKPAGGFLMLTWNWSYAVCFIAANPSCIVQLF